MTFVRAVVGILALDFWIFLLHGTIHCLVQDLISSLGFAKVERVDQRKSLELFPVFSRNYTPTLSEQQRPVK